MVKVLARINIDEFYSEIKKAYESLKGVVYNTPIDFSNTFSRLSGGKVFLKLENLQKTGAFKVRGAYYKIRSLPKEKLAKGVIAASAGNHAQGVAYAASVSGVRAVIVMPETTPASKVLATKSYGAEVVLHGRIYDDAYRKAMEICEKEGLTFIHPFDDPKVIAGQGTIAIEIINSLPKFDVILVPVGGGGLISGISIAIRKVFGKNVRIIGIEPEAAPKFKISLKHGKPVVVPSKPSLADGLVTKKPGNLTFKIVNELVDEVVTVSEDEIARAMFLLLERGKLLAEGAGAAPLAALLSGKVDVKGKTVVAIVSGGNADLTTIYRVILRGLSLERRVIKLRAILKDVPGTLKEVLNIVASNRGNIVDIKHDRFSLKAGPGYAVVELIIELLNPEAKDTIIKEISKLGYRVEIIE